MKQPGKTSLSDMPFKEMENDFGTERYVNGLIRFIENSSAPITIALQGEWGSGKTSMMTRLERSLCIGDNASFIGVSINTWEYSMMSTPEFTVYRILARLVQKLTKDDSDTKKTFKKFMRGAGNILYRGLREVAKGAGPLAGVGIEMLAPSDFPFGSDENDTASLSELKIELERAIQRRIEADGKRGVIVFVDDLDRLNPPVAVEILELLKNVFTLDNCIFVLAIDYDVVVKGLEPKFGKLTDKNEREFRSFFDKIIQVPFSLPVSSYRPMDFVLKALVDIGYLNDFDASDPNVITRFSAVVESSVGKNPRSIKRLINTLSLLDCIDRQIGMRRPGVHPHLFRGIIHIRPCRVHIAEKSGIVFGAQRRADIGPPPAPVIFQELHFQTLLPVLSKNRIHKHFLLLSCFLDIQVHPQGISSIKSAVPILSLSCFPKPSGHPHIRSGIFPSRPLNPVGGLFL